MDYFETKVSDDYTLESFKKYFREVFKMFNYLSNFYRIFADKRAKFIHTVINDVIDEKFHGLTLSQKSILLLSSVEGVDCVLVGARNIKYVDDVLKVLDYEKIENAMDVFVKIREDIKSIIKQIL
jgi:aryl-alcohol dehydrogenase-like predicted oxidoreductase